MADDFPTPESGCHKGAHGELIASAWLLGLGYEVFHNVSRYGPADLTIWDPETGEMHLIDVKTSASRNVYERSDGDLVFPVGGRGRDDVLKLAVVGAHVLGFVRRLEIGCEFYWPLAKAKPAATFSPKAKSYHDVRAARLTKPCAPSKTLEGAWR